MLESVTRAAADDPQICCLRMAVDDEVVVRCVFVLADAGFNQRSAFQPREAEADVITCSLQSLLRNHSIYGRGVEFGAARIISDLESATLVAGNAIQEAVTVICPHGKFCIRITLISAWDTEEKHLLARGANSRTDDVRENLAQPRTASKNVPIGSQF